MPGAICPRHFAHYDRYKSENEKGKHKGVKASLGIVGILSTIVSVWWFALRPRRKKDQE